MLKGKRILLGISGGIAAYKTPELIRLFVKAGAEVKVIATQHAFEFVTRLTLQTVSKNAVYSNTFEESNEYSTEHIALNDWADILLVAPATANILGKFAGGIAADALSTTYLAFEKPVFVAAAMNCKMWAHSAVQANMEKLHNLGVRFIESTEGELACGDVGKGRMEEPSVIFKLISEYFAQKLPWSGKTILITAGPTYEKIDPVRFIGNYSSGKMGFALAEACANRGAQVKLIAGPVSLKTAHPLIERIDVESASDMFSAATTLFPSVNAAILCAAVADFTPVQQYNSKKKRGEEDLLVHLKPTHDIAAKLGELKIKPQILVGFALETDAEIQNAQSKLVRKNLDFIVLNSLQNPGAGFQHDTNQITILKREGGEYTFPLKSKKEVAEDILNELNNYFINI
ncbi:MAG: bifunctional phosphopantothenoylcysteine decarboxylase/phosphopantothenate--cysteine ligase CoaBC [Bacteroidia bacterium]|nr:bifunctional phosphopantothenoylcysteine decarboxylase/phosphopantothenate--cysteine ligase CoaBC [Bacteroidia bacterium]